MILLLFPCLFVNFNGQQNRYVLSVFMNGSRCRCVSNVLNHSVFPLQRILNAQKTTVFESCFGTRPVADVC